MPSSSSPPEALLDGPASAEGRRPAARPRRLRRRAGWLGAGALSLALVGSVVVLRGPDTDMPVGDLPGWQQVFAEDFDTDAPLGEFPGSAYDERWTGYEGIKDTSGAGTYSNERVVSVADGMLDMYLHTEKGKPLVAAPIPLVDGKWGGQVYGRFSVRFRADPVPGYKTAWLLWPDSNKWAEGEVDFPEGKLDGSMYAANLCVGKPGKFCLHETDLGTYEDWHIATIEWTPDAVTYFLDGEQVAQSDSVPSTPMHWVLQTETAFGKPDASAAGHVQVDWATVYRMDPDEE